MTEGLNIETSGLQSAIMIALAHLLATLPEEDFQAFVDDCLGTAERMGTGNHNSIEILRQSAEMHQVGKHLERIVPLLRKQS